jgi:GT2 family glycosyltransferase
MDKARISVGLVTWNSAEKLAATLEALKGQVGVALELVVVDNASRDESVAVVNQHFSGVRLICNETNRGYCGGHNQGIAASSGEYYLPLNPDIQLDPGYLAAMVRAIETSPVVGMAAGKLLLGGPGETPRRIDSTGLFIDRKRRQYLRGFGEVDTGQYDSAGEVFGVDGAAPLYRRSMLEEIRIDGQYFDEAFFAHKEDVDLSWRARIAGWKCWYTPEAVAYHERQFRPGSREHMAPQIRMHAVKNRYLLLLRNESWVGWRRDWLPIFWYDMKILGYLLLKERSSLIGLRMLYEQRSRIKEWRKSIWAQGKVDPERLLQWFG